MASKSSQNIRNGKQHSPQKSAPGSTTKTSGYSKQKTFQKSIADFDDKTSDFIGCSKEEALPKPVLKSSVVASDTSCSVQKTKLSVTKCASRTESSTCCSNQKTSQKLGPESVARTSNIFEPTIWASWAAKLETAGLPKRLIKLVQKAEFEDWVMQQNHQVGDGLFYSDEFQSLPPRFQKKIMAIAYEVLNHYCTPEEALLKLTTPELPEKSESLSDQRTDKETEKSTSESSFKHSVSVNDKKPSTSVAKNHSEDHKSDISMSKCDNSQHHKRAFERTWSTRSNSFRGSPKHSRKKGPVESPKQQDGLIKHGEKYNPDMQKGKTKSPQYDKSRKSDIPRKGDWSEDKTSYSCKSECQSRDILHVQNQSTASKPTRQVKSSGAVECLEKPSPTDLVCSQSPGIQERKSSFRYPARGFKGAEPKFSERKGSSKNSVSGSQITNSELPKEHTDPPDLKYSQSSVRKESSSRNFLGSPKNTKHENAQNNYRQVKVNDPNINNIIKAIEKHEGKYEGVPRGQECKRLEIKVSDKAEDVSYWEKVLKEALNQDHFKVSVASPYTQTLCLTFYDAETAKRARFLLRRKNHKQSGGPVIVRVSDVKLFSEAKISKYINQSSSEVLGKIHERSLESIKGLFLRYKSLHDEKIKIVEEELKTLDPQSEEHATADSKLHTLLGMKQVFTDYSNNVKDKILSLDKNKEYMKMTEHIKNDFIRECNCIDGCLPIYSKKREILDVVRNNLVSIIVANTGSGKSTQLVQYLYRDGYADKGLIICTQPRKIAAISLSQYISGQMGSAVGDTVGYEIGVRKKISKVTKIVYMTDYTLLRRCLYPKQFDNVSCVIVDEAHERSLYTDLLLGMLKKISKNRQDLKIIITSATIDPWIFLHYFDVSAEAVVKVPGRVYPVEIKWGKDAFVGWKYVEASVDCAYDIHLNSPQGAILVFLTSPGEVEEAVGMFEEKVKRERTTRSELSPMILALHGKLAAEDQLKVFEPCQKNHRKIIFATNSAETSLTIPDIKYVVDSGMSKELHYDVEKKRSALVVGFVSRSSATQRKGRAGRTQSGVCYRLYSENNYHNDMIECSPPEILCCPLQQALLKIMELKINPYKFDFISAPPTSSIEDAMYSLQLLGAVSEGSLTDLGKKIAKLQLEPQLGKLVMRGIQQKVGYEASIIAALAPFSGQIFCRNEENKVEADQEKLLFCHEFGDFFTYLIIYNEWVKVPKAERDMWCHKHFIRSKTMKIAENIVGELCLTIWNELGVSIEKCFARTSFIANLFEPLMFECFSENIFIYSGHDRAGYLSPNLEGSFYIHPSSSLCYLDQELPQFVVCSVVLRTSRNFLLNVTPVSESTIVKAYDDGQFFFPIDLLKRLRVSPVIYKPVGEILLIRYFLGKDGGHVKELEKKLRLVTKSSTFHISVSVQEGEITAYVQPHHRVKVSKLIDQVLDEGRLALAAEEEVFAADSDIPFSFALSSAANVHDVILPGESRDVVVSCRRGGILNKSNSSKALNILKLYGPLVSHKEIENCHSLLITFEKVASVDKALAGFCNNQTYEVVKGKVKPFKNKLEDEPLFRIRVSWPRLMCKGTGSIEFFDSSSCIEACYNLTCSSIYVGDNYIMVEATRTPEKLSLRNLPAFASEEDILAALNKRFPHLRIKNLTLQREKAIKTSYREIDAQKSKLQRIFAPFAAPKNLEIDVTKPEEADLKWSAVVYFRHLEDCQNALQQLRDSIKIDSCKANISVVLKSQVFCNPPVYKILRKDIEACSKKYQASSRIVTEKRRGCYVITLSCSDVSHLSEMRKEVIKLVEGRHISCLDNPKLSKLFEQGSRVSFEEIEKSTRTIIKFDPARRMISIYGSERARDEAENHIINMMAGSSIVKTKVFDLHAKTLPTGFLKELYKQYGCDLRSFTESFELKRAFIDFGKRQLILEGPYKRICEAEEHLEDICFNLAEEAEKKSDSNSEICPICFDNISYMDSIRLENCGHAICKLCLQLQLKSRIFPVVCVSKDCGKPFFVEDFRKIFASQPSMKQPFAMSALEYFIQKNMSEVRYCPVPDCQMIYRVTTKEQQTLCYGCENYICTRCHNLFHHGMSCEMFKQTKVDEDYPLKMWLSADAENRKLCPNCTTAIEKTGGCNHMFCSKCEKHLCWLCLRIFQTADEVYEHIPYCPNNS